MSIFDESKIPERIHAICARIAAEKAAAGSYVSAWCSITVFGKDHMVPTEALPEITPLLGPPSLAQLEALEAEVRADNNDLDTRQD